MTEAPLSPAWIASRLTPAQRAALMWLPEDGGWRDDMGDYDGVLSIWPVRLEIDEDLSIEASLAVLANSTKWSATPLGLRVRAVVAGGVDG